MSEIIAGLLATLSHAFGGNPGWAIVTLSLGIRLALLPLTIALARRARRNQAILQTLQPEIEQLKKQFEKKPERLFAELRRLYQRHDFNPLDLPTLLGSLLQLPIFALLYQAIRSSVKPNSLFLWIRNLAAPDLFLTLLILTLTGCTAWFLPSASAQMKSSLIAFQIIVTFIIVWKLAAGLGLYWASSSLVGLFQALWLHYRAPAPQNRPV